MNRAHQISGHGAAVSTITEAFRQGERHLLSREDNMESSVKQTRDRKILIIPLNTRRRGSPFRNGSGIIQIERLAEGSLSFIHIYRLIRNVRTEPRSPALSAAINARSL